jgi:hypothetical protein
VNPVEAKFRNVKVGDRIRCPGDGALEKVTTSVSNGNGKWRLRTDRHDHIREATAPVVILEQKKTPQRRIK